MRRAVMVVFLLSLALVPTAQANGGVINSVSVVGDGVVGAQRLGQIPGALHRQGVLAQVDLRQGLVHLQALGHGVRTGSMELKVIRKSRQVLSKLSPHRLQHEISVYKINTCTPSDHSTVADLFQ